MLKLQVVSEWDHVDLKNRLYGYAKEVFDNLQTCTEREREMAYSLLMSIAETYPNGIPEETLNDYIGYQLLEDLEEMEREEI